MTNEEAREIISKVTFYWELGEQTLTQKQINEALDMAIKALEQQSSEDCISRETALKAFAEKCAGECACCEYNGSGYDTAENCKLIKSLSSVTPTISKMEQVEDCISRKDILEAIETWDKFGVNAEQKLIRWQDHYVPYVHLDDVRNAIANMPSVTPQQRVGKWKEAQFGGFICSECGNYTKGEWSDKLNEMTPFKYCPECGAKMEVEE